MRFVVEFSEKIGGCNLALVVDADTGANARIEAANTLGYHLDKRVQAIKVAPADYVPGLEK